MNNYNLSKQVILVTGASGYLGQEIVSQLISLGAKVICADTSLKILREVSKKNNWGKSAFLINFDISKEVEVKKSFSIAIKKFGQINSIINNAGLSVFEPWTKRKDKDFNDVMAVNLKGTFYCMREFFNHLKKKKHQGVVVNIASHYGVISPDPRIYIDNKLRNSEIYGATKAGVIQMTKYFAVNAPVEGLKVRVNAIAPGGIYNKTNPQDKQFVKNYSTKCPMKRMAEVKEIVGPILFLLSKDSSYINGHTIIVDGGMSSW